MPVHINITMYNTGTSNQKGISQPSSLCARLVCWGHHVQSRVQGYAMCALIMPLRKLYHDSRVLVVWMRCQILIQQPTYLVRCVADAPSTRSSLLWCMLARS